jgi:hypothetical protein
LLLSAVAVARPSARTWADSSLRDSVVLVIRHGEKPETGTGLTAVGEARAKAYVSYFAHYRVDGKPFHPDYLFATKDSKNSFRERLTLLPLSEALKEPLDLRFKNKEYPDMVEALKTKRYGKNIVICWHHGHIADIVTALGGDAAKLIPGGKWPDDHFDWVIQLVFDHAGHLVPGETKRVEEHLLPSDH